MNRLEQMKKVARLYKKNKPIEEIAREMDLSKTVIYKWLYAMGLKNKKAEPVHVKIVKMYQEGKSSFEIAFKLEISRNYVNSVLRDAGLVQRRYLSEEERLITEDTVYANKRKIKKETVEFEGKKYEVINHLFFTEE